MPVKTINFSELDSQPIEIQEAIAFYAAHTVLPVHFSAADRDRYYKILEQAGFIESVNM
ncbi:hypothetical protein [Paenibacillus sp.]|uniref:hypothetical protein n=1 Tax=Paenibacillus sp. TaxID=58172 RepID=UPI002824F7B0|nr:hypothetical protein [Paenibacillus sp.]MDR0269611.1 hypothetical protein [Paenibacillus sp.]